MIGLGSDEAMRGVSRGDSWFVDLEGATVVPLGDGDPAWPVDATLEVGGRADLVILTTGPAPALRGPSRAILGASAVHSATGVSCAGSLPRRPAGDRTGAGAPDRVSRR